MTFLNFLMVVIMGFQAFIYWRQRDLMEIQANLTQDSIDSSKKSAEHQLRAYISAIKIEPPEDAISGFVNWRRWKIIIRNHGQTPAIGVRIKTGCAILPKRIDHFSDLTKWDVEPDSSTDVCPREKIFAFTVFDDSISVVSRAGVTSDGASTLQVGSGFGFRAIKFGEQLMVI